MLRFSHTAVGVQQGRAFLFSAFEDNGPMWTGTGPRVERVPVSFATPFRGPPVVHVGLSMWDISVAANQRVDIAAEDVTASGFTLVFRTWADTRVARVRADWLAIGPADHVDDFAVD
ncbi:H-type lectin domain-containing protein [Paracoccus niistensis]|uniref:H-type lectin domain-containing protein n=1 Tax=Paracoccus niistensis TaxID=632935 RepID=A0ABV6I7W3_9RHOB